MKKWFALLLTAALLLSVTPSLAEGQVLKYGTDAEPIGFDPHTISAVASVRVISVVYNTLVDVDEELNVIPELALSWEQPDDMTYVFHLRDDVKFHNGRKMTAEDVKYSFERILNPNTAALGNSASYAGDIDTVEVIDDTTVKFTLKNVNAPFLANLSSSYCSIVAKEIVDENGDLLRADAGTGPFKMVEWVPDNRVVVEKFPDYFLEGEPKLDGIEYYVMSDSSARLAALRTGTVDLIVADTSMLPLVEGEESVKVVSYETRDYETICLNLNFEPFKDIRVRQAISLAISREEIIDIAHNGKALVAGFVPPSCGHWAVDVASHPLYQQDIEKAKALMAEAGYESGFDVVCTVGLLDTIRDTGTMLEQQLGEIGIRLNVQNLENAQYVANWSAHDFEMMVCHNGAGADPSRGVAFFFSTTGAANIAEYSNARVDELCTLAAATPNTDVREEYYNEAIGIILEECPNVTICSPYAYYLTSQKLMDYTPSVVNPSLSTCYLAE